VKGAGKDVCEEGQMFVKGKGKGNLIREKSIF
jgi:hypothetical protein